MRIVSILAANSNQNSYARSQESVKMWSIVTNDSWWARGSLTALLDEQLKHDKTGDNKDAKHDNEEGRVWEPESLGVETKR